MASPVLLQTCQLEEFAAELSNWELVPYPLVCLAQHELKHGLGLNFYVDKWPSCSAAIVIPTKSCKDLFLRETVYADATDNKQLKELLKQVPIDWTKQFYFVAVYEKKGIFASCEEISKLRHGTLTRGTREHTMILSRAVDHKFRDEYTFGELHDEDVGAIVKNWPCSGNLSREAVEDRVKHGVKFPPNMAVKDVAGSLVGYEVISQFGSMSMLHVDPDHRRKGLAKAMVSRLSKDLETANQYCYCHISMANESSIELHKRCGFTIVDKGEVVWALFKPIKE